MVSPSSRAHSLLQDQKDLKSRKDEQNDIRPMWEVNKKTGYKTYYHDNPNDIAEFYLVHEMSSPTNIIRTSTLRFGITNWNKSP
jgi:hypothetical protein